MNINTVRRLLLELRDQYVSELQDDTKTFGGYQRGSETTYNQIVRLQSIHKEMCGVNYDYNQA